MNPYRVTKHGINNPRPYLPRHYANLINQCKITQYQSTYLIQRVCSLVVTRVSVAHQVLGSISVEANILKFSGIVLSRRQRGSCGDFINLKDLPTQSSKMLVEIEFVKLYCVIKNHLNRSPLLSSPIYSQY